MPYILAIVNGLIWEFTPDADLAWMLNKNYTVYTVLPIDY